MTGAPAAADAIAAESRASHSVADAASGGRDGLKEATKQHIREALGRLAATPGFKPRRSQRLMIAEVAKTLAGEYGGERVLCVEGPTGTGKSLGYLLSAIPVAQEREKTLVIATATVALQEQLTKKDLPDLQARAELDFTFALAKGRRRYVCDRDLRHLAGVDENQASLDLGEDETPGATWPIRPTEGEIAEVQAMWSARDQGRWGGDLDEWSAPLRGDLREVITTDAAGCTGKHCPSRANCAFFAARKARNALDVIVANHALVMTDLMLGGGVVLPEPEHCIYIFDEGHHLPGVAVEQGAAHTRLISPRNWLSELGKLPDKAASALAGQSEIANNIEAIGSDLAGELPQLVERLGDLHRALQSAHPALKADAKSPAGRRRRGDCQRGTDPNWRFPLGWAPDEMRSLFEEARAASTAVKVRVLKLSEQIKKGVESDPDNQGLAAAHGKTQWIAARIDAMESAFVQFAAPAPEDPATPPPARWIESIDQGSDFQCCASPISAAALLRSLLWERCDGAVITSATLAALGRFERLFERAGLGPRYATRAVRLDSPFDYQNNAELVVPAVRADPKDHDRHTAEIVQRFNQDLIDPAEGTLVLFASYRQMRAVAEGLDREIARRMLMQGSAPRHELLEQHRTLIRFGRGSILFGVASFAEGVDLPGRECTHVIIAKLPFSVPSSPVEATRAEWLEAHGRNPFMEMSVPDASFRLIQAAGRLLRTEHDTGRVTVLDRRLIDKPYGRQMMDALPPFRRRIEQRE